ncbi:hypothetical protein [Bacillus sp. FSL K6-6540]|uniref:hypothetical protein n=1 Tax=Bacillus sp. FSL K6-6540 TaxID=2921512 RepID=UPI0030F5286E
MRVSAPGNDHNQPELNNNEDVQPKKVKEYKIGDLVNFRLSNSTVDIMNLLNEKKRQGVKISNYLINLIRIAEGLPIPGAEGESMQEVRALPANSTKQIEESVLGNEELLEKLMSRLLGRMQASGLQISPASTEEPNDSSVPDEETKQELQDIAAGMLDWDD